MEGGVRNVYRMKFHHVNLGELEVNHHAGEARMAAAARGGGEGGVAQRGGSFVVVRAPCRSLPDIRYLNTSCPNTCTTVLPLV